MLFRSGSGGAALELLNRSERLDLVLVDFAMPGMNGAELAREIRARSPGVPILFATGYAGVEDLVETTDEMIVQKPFTAEQLAEKVIAVFEGAGSRSGQTAGRISASSSA